MILVNSSHLENEIKTEVDFVDTSRHTYLLDIPRQPTYMKLGSGGLYQPIQSYVFKKGSYMSCRRFVPPVG